MNQHTKIPNVQWVKGHPYVRFQHRGARVSEPCTNEFFKARGLKGNAELKTRAARMIEILRGEIDQKLNRGTSLGKSPALRAAATAYFEARIDQPSGKRPRDQHLDRIELGLIRGARNHPSLCAFLGERKKLGRITPTDLERYQRALEDRGFARDSIRSWMSDIRAFLTWCERERLIIKNPIRPGGYSVPSAGALKDAELPYSDLDLAKIHQTLKPGSSVARFWTLGELTGARRSEILRVRFADFRLADGVLEIQGAAKNAERRSKRRLVPVTKALSEFILRLNPSDNAAYVCSMTQDPCRLEAVKSSLRRASRRARIKLKPQRLRRTYAQRLREAGESREVIAEILGNSPGVLDQWYIHPTAPRLSEEGLRALEQLHGGRSH